MKRLVILAIVTLILTGCAGDKLAGLWVNVELDFLKIQLNEDGTGIVEMPSDRGDITWRVEDSELCLSFSEFDPGTCLPYTLEGDRMTVDFGDGTPQRFERWPSD